jgi:hypothetical protein
MTELNKPIDWNQIDGLDPDKKEETDNIENDNNLEIDLELESFIIGADEKEYDITDEELDDLEWSDLIPEIEVAMGLEESESIEIIEESKPEVKKSHYMRRVPRKNEVLDEFDLFIPKPEGFELDPSASAWTDLINGDDSRRINELKELVHEILKSKTDISILNNRRKPSKTNFNVYYGILVKDLVGLKYSYSEILVELSYYFSDNLFNMFKMLDKKWGNIILNELEEKYDINLDDMDIF